MTSFIRRTAAAAALVTALGAQTAAASEGPVPAPAPAALPAAQDQPFPGVIRLAVDARDTSRRIIRVHESLPLTGAPELVLYYPQWLPGDHSPSGPVDRVAGLVFTASGRDVPWVRDTVDLYAFHLRPPAGARTLEVDFQFLAGGPSPFGGTDFSSGMALLEWVNLALYPAGYFTRDIPVEASLTVPDGWSLATSLERTGGEGSRATFRSTSFETLADSPVFAGRYAKTLDLAPQGAPPVRLDAFADRPEDLPVKAEQIEPHRRLVEQAGRLFGAHHYDHYDFLVALSDAFSPNGLEHHKSSEDSVGAAYFSDWEKMSALRDLLPHEYTHSWNGKFRRPADLWTPTFNTPMRDTLLWVYEGQTEYWGKVLAVRSGLRTRAQYLDDLAAMAAHFQGLAGREWRPLQDTTNDEILYLGHAQPWASWQRRTDYYDEGALIWLEADTLIRERSGGRRSLNDFAHAFFGIGDGSVTPVTYTFADLVQALNAVEPYDWAGFLRTRLKSKGRPAPLDGLTRGGYRLVFTDTPSEITLSEEALSKATDLSYSLGLTTKADGVLEGVSWDGPAFQAGLRSGVRIISVDGQEFTPEVLKNAVIAAKGGSRPIELIVKDAERYRTVQIEYRGGLRYPHLERIEGTPARLDDIAKPLG